MSTNKASEKPTPEAKALSLFLMAHKSKDNAYKEKAKRMNRLWDQVRDNALTKEDYASEVERTLNSYGGYAEVVEKTVQFYINKTGAWKLEGQDKYCKDARAIADKIMELRGGNKAKD